MMLLILVFCTLASAQDPDPVADELAVVEHLEVDAECDPTEMLAEAEARIDDVEAALSERDIEIEDLQSKTAELLRLVAINQGVEVVIVDGGTIDTDTDTDGDTDADGADSAPVRYVEHDAAD